MTTRFLPTGLHVLERGWLSSNNIVFSDGAQTVMVDSGYCTHAAQTLALVEDILGERPLDLLVNTHLHSDHCGGNAALQNRYPALETRIPPGESAQKISRSSGLFLLGIEIFLQRDSAAMDRRLNLGVSR